VSSKKIIVTDESTGRSTELPILEGSTGVPTVDIKRLPKDLGYFTFDQGFGATAACESKVTFIDGQKGILAYRGYPIEQLAEKSNFLEVAYLLMNGSFPNTTEFQSFQHDVTYHTMIHESMKKFIDGFNYDAHPMAMMVSVVGSLAAFYHDSLDMNNPEDRQLAAVRLIAKMPTIAAACFRHSIGWPYSYPKNSLDYSSRLLHMMFSVPAEPFEVNEVAAKALDLLFILHADHEQNASTSTVRLVGSTGANPYASVAAGICALWGPAHGGANEAVLEMLNEIGDVKNVPKFIDRAKDRDDPGFWTPGLQELRSACDFDP